MKITFIGHASIHVQGQDLSLLCDPIFTDTFCEGLNAPHPSRSVITERLPHYDAVFISHRHLDHFDVASLQLLRRSADIFIPDDPLLETVLKEIGFRSVVRLKEWEHLNLGSTSFVTTSSSNPVPELGIVLFESSNTFWNQVDTVSTAESISVVKRYVGEIDYVLAPWQPFLETSLQLSGDLRFPFRLYESLLREMEMVGAHYVTPGASGLKFIDRSQVLNHVAFPVTANQVRRDVECGFVNPPKVLLTKPGDVAVLENNEVRIEPAAAEWVTTAPERSAHTTVFCPTALGGAFQEALRLHPVEPLNHRWQSVLDAVEAVATTPAGLALHSWKVVYQLVIEGHGQLHPWWFDFSAAQPEWHAGWNPLRSYVVFISADLLDRLLSEQISWSFVVTSGEYCVVDMVYQYRDEKVHRPQDAGVMILDPLFGALGKNLESLLLGSLRAELAALTATEIR